MPNNKIQSLTVSGVTYDIVDNTSGYAKTDSPAFTGTPTAPTASSGDSSTQIATTAFVQDAMSGAGAGTVTSVAVANDTNGGLSVSGSPITSSGTITLGHSNVLTSAQTTQALYPIKIDKNGHISEYGSAVSITDEKVAISTTTNNTSYYPILGTETTASTRQYDKSFKYFTAAGYSLITIGDPNLDGSSTSKIGGIQLIGTNHGSTTLYTSVAEDVEYGIYFPAKGGTVALTSDIPTVPSISLNGSSTTSASFYAPTSAGTSGQVLTSNGSGAPTWSAITVPTKTSDLTNDSGFITGMTILSYGNSTWQDFLDAYNANKVVYCRASSNSNPASGSQTRLAFMAYVNNATNPTNVEFQYYRSVSTHTESQQGDQVYVYKLDKTTGWSVTVREASVKVVAGTGLSGTYSNGTMTLTGPTISLNGSSTTSASFYAPTTAGTSGYVLTSNGSGAPTWAEVSTSDTKVTQTVISDSSSNKKGLLLSNGDGSSTLTSTSYTSATLQYQPSTRTLSLREYGNPLTPGANLFLSYDTITFAGENFNTDLKQALNPNSHRTIYLPNADGTLALTSDIPTVPTISLNGTSTTSPSFYAPTTAGTSGYYLKSNGSGAPSWTSFPTIINTRGTPTSGGTTLSVVNTGDMYTWNNKSQVQIVTWSEE